MWLNKWFSFTTDGLNFLIKKSTFQLPPERAQFPPSPLLLRIFVAYVAEPNPPKDPCIPGKKKNRGYRRYQAFSFAPGDFPCQILGKLLFCNWFFQVTLF